MVVVCQQGSELEFSVFKFKGEIPFRLSFVPVSARGAPFPVPRAKVVSSKTILDDHWEVDVFSHLALDLRRVTVCIPLFTLNPRGFCSITKSLPSICSAEGRISIYAKAP